MGKEGKSETKILRKKTKESPDTSAQLSIPSKTASPHSEGETMELIHDLQTYQIELEMQNIELQRAIDDADQAKADADIATSKYRDLYDFAPSGYCTLSKLGEVTELNITCAKMLGTERIKTINSRFGFFVSTDTLPVFNLFLDKVFQGKIQETCEVILLNDNDLTTHVLLTGIIIDNEELCNVTMVDITARKHMEYTLKDEKNRIRAILDMVIVPIFLKDNDHRITDANRAFLDMFDMEKKNLIGKTLMEEVPENQRQYFLEVDRRVLATGVPDSQEEELTLKDCTRTIITSKMRFFDDSGKIGLICSIHDITERKQAEEEKLLFEQQLQYTQKMESLGQLSEGIAHNFNNILGIIIGYCDLTKRNVKTAAKNIPEIEKAAERAAIVCRQMMAYSGQEKLTKTKINMVMQVNETIVMLKSSLPQNAVIKTNLSASIPMIEGDVSQLNQVLMNLIINASEAIGTVQGEVNVSLAKFDVIAGKTLEDYSGNPIPPGEYICLEVTDNGCGMDEAILSRLFEPFFTTKFTGRGLGMSAVLGIIQSHGGALQLFSQHGQGTTVIVYLSTLVDELTGEDSQSTSTASESWQGNGTILLVEDEEDALFLAKELLKMFGFTVLEAVNGKEALEMYQKNAADITLILTDIGMPVMDGYELVEKLKKLKPELPIVISTGYSDGDVKERIGSDNIAGIISKPYNSDKLLEVLKSVVEGI